MPTKTLHGNPYPQNPNTNRRPPPQVDVSTGPAREFLRPEGLSQRLREYAKQAAAGDVQADVALNAFITDYHQFMRADQGERALPGAYNGTDTQAYFPLPYSPTEQHRPDRDVGTPQHEVWAAAGRQIQTDDMVDRLKDRFKAQEDTTWNRVGNEAGERPARESSEPSLRDTISAAASLGD